MKRIVIYCFFVVNSSGMFAMESSQIKSYHNMHTTDPDYEMGKTAITKTRQYAACGSVASGFSFFVATAARHMHWPYWVKRAPLFGFISCNALNQMPVIFGIEQNRNKTTALGHTINALKKA